MADAVTERDWVIKTLFDALRRRGLRIDIAAEVRVCNVLRARPQFTDDGQLREVLRACIVSTLNEAALFDDVFRETRAPARNPVAGPEGKRTAASPPGPPSLLPGLIEEIHRKKREWLNSIAATACFALAIWLIHSAPPSRSCDNCNDLITFDARLVIVALLLACAMGLFIFLVWPFSPEPVRRAIMTLVGRGKDPGSDIPTSTHGPRGPEPPLIPVEDLPLSPKEVYFRSGFVGGNIRRLSQGQIEEIADDIAYDVGTDDFDHPDIPQSIRETLNQGKYPAIVPSKRRQVRSVVLIEDVWADGRFWNPIVPELRDGLSARGLTADYIALEGSFDDRGGHGGAGTVFARISEIVETNHPAIVLFATDGAHIKGSDRQRLAQLAQQAPVVWLDHRDPGAWDESIMPALLDGVPVFTADAAGILAVLRTIAESDAHFEPMARMATERRSNIAGNAVTPLAIAMHLGPALNWARDCAVIQPISVSLIERLRNDLHRRVHPLACGRFSTLPGSTIGAGGFSFSSDVEEVLLRGFRQRPESHRRAVARIVKAALDAEIPPGPGVARDAWIWTGLRVDLIKDPDQATLEAIKELTADESCQIRDTVRAEISRLTRNQPRNGVILERPIVEVFSPAAAVALQEVLGQSASPITHEVEVSVLSVHREVNLAL